MEVITEMMLELTPLSYKPANLLAVRRAFQHRRRRRRNTTIWPGAIWRYGAQRNYYSTFKIDLRHSRTL